MSWSRVLTAPCRQEIYSLHFPLRASVFSSAHGGIILPPSQSSWWWAELLSMLTSTTVTTQPHLFQFLSGVSAFVTLAVSHAEDNLFRSFWKAPFSLGIQDLRWTRTNPQKKGKQGSQVCRRYTHLGLLVRLWSFWMVPPPGVVINENS